MLTPSPQLDRRDLAAILSQARALAPFYTPDWDAAQETGGGAVLLQVFARLLEGLIRRLNEVPRKNMIAFLDMLGVRLLPAQPARAPLTFFLSTGAQEAVEIPQHAQVAATPPGSDPIVFETERAILATPAQLKAIVSVVPAHDQIFDHTASLQAGTPVELFADDDQNLQEHSLYLAQGELFNLKGTATITLRLALSGPSLSPALLATELSWEWWNDGHWVPSTVPAFQAMLKASASAAATKLANELPAGATEMTVTTNVASDKRFPTAGLLLIDDEMIRYSGKRSDSFTGLTRGVGGSASGIPGASAATDHTAGTEVQIIDEPLLVTAAGGGAGQPASVGLKKAFATPFSKTTVNGSKNFWLRCRVPGNLLASPLRNLAIDTIGVSAEASGSTAALPDALFRNDIPLELPVEDKPVYPFGRQPHTADTFYIASDDALAKSGATITLDLAASPGGIGSIPVQRIQGIGDTFAERLRSRQVGTVDELLNLSAEQLAEYLAISPTRARNVLEAAQKEFYDKTGIFKAIAGEATAAADEDLALSWEYWNGKGWQLIKGLVDNTVGLRTHNTVVFTCPSDSASVAVGGQEHYWMRVRIASGDYGREQFTYDESAKTWRPDRSQIKPPLITQLAISYSFATPAKLDQCLTYNNRDFVDRTRAVQTAGQPFSAFTTLETAEQSLYLGFDAPPVKGPISIFFSLVEQEYTEQNRPRVDWTYLQANSAASEGTWTRLLVTDGTRDLTESGTVTFIGPTDFAQAARFGQIRYWVRALDRNNAFQPQSAAAQPPPLTPPGTVPVTPLQPRAPAGLSAAAPRQPAIAIQPCAESLEFFRPPFSVAQKLRQVAAAPQVRGIYLNTTWAIQAETISKERLGSSSGEPNQTYQLARFPVITEDIWVNEYGALSEGERTALAARSDIVTDPVTDLQGKVSEFWVCWNAVDDLTTAAATDRAYTIDRTFGQVRFGNGVQGTVPPAGRDNIRASYQAGGGASGNVAASQITTLRTTIPYVERATNPEGASSGADTETLERAIERGPQHIKNRGRAVTAEDFEWIAREASRAIARVKCLPLFNDQGASQTGWVTLIIVPSGDEARPAPTPRLRQRVEQYLRERAANVIAFPEHIQVTGPTYVEVGVSATLVPVTLDRAPQVEGAALRRLASFLHPLTGGYQSTGWEFGRLPCLSDFYALLEDIAGVDHVEQLSLTLTALTPSGKPVGEPAYITEDRPLAATMPDYALVCSGQHTITLKALG